MKKFMLCLLALVGFYSASLAAITFVDLSAIAKDPYFQGRIQYALHVAAINVVSEDPGTQNHGTRVTFANRVLKGDVNIFEVTLGVLTNATVASEATSSGTPAYAIPDSDIQFVVNSLFSIYAGVAN